MIIVKLMGGLGNQMFQYAFGKYLAIKNNTELKLDTTFLLDRSPKNEHFVYRDYDLSIFHIDENFATNEEIKALTQWSNINLINNLLHKFLGTKWSYIKYMKYHFLPQHLNIPDNSYIEGYWQSEKYFSSISHELKNNDYSFKEPLMDISMNYMEKIKNSNAVCINVRRGDFVTSSFHGAMGVEYYTQAANILLNKYENIEFFVFSDEIGWCEQNLNFSVPTTFVSHNYAGNKFQDYLRLMIACKHFIIPNSSFAWWAAWLSSYENKIVIAPKLWFNPKHPTFLNFDFENFDIIPENWIKL